MNKLFITLYISFAICFYSSAQLSFVRDTSVQVIDDSLPLKNAWAGGLNYPMFEPIDLNGDGIMDLVVYEPNFGPPGNSRLMPFINYGDSGRVDYHYAPEYINLFPPDIRGWLVTYDYNCDGKMDLFTLSYSCSCGIMVYRNDYTPLGGLKFTKILDPINTYYDSQQYNISANGVTVPVFTDIDGDGDMDILGWPVGGTITFEYYHGLWVDSGWSCDSLRFKNVTACWGHFELTYGANLALLDTVFCRQMEPDSALLWDAGNTVKDDTQSCLCIYKQDTIISNRNKDLLVGGYADNNMIYLHNGGPPEDDGMDYEDSTWPGYNVPVNLPSFPCAYNLDVNNDMKKDMIIAPHSVSDYRGILYYKNTDIPNDTPIFARQPHTFLQEEMIEVGTQSAPQLFDYDADGLQDLLIGDWSYYDTTGVYHKGITLYKNIGTPSYPKFKLITRDYAGIDALNGVGGIHPAFGDLNGDGAIDMIVGMGSCPPTVNCPGNGDLLYYVNTAGAGNPANFVLTSVFYDGINVGQFSAPQLYDLNHDGLLDLIVGNSSGIIKYFKNTGTATSPAFSAIPDKDTLGGIIIQYPGYTNSTGYASPFFYNDSGIDKLIVGTQSGKVYVYDNIDGNIFGAYHLADSLINGEEGQNLIPVIGDINNDGHPDMIIGNYDGGVSLFMNKYGTVGLNELHKTIRSSFDAYPNPANDELHLNFYHLENKHAQFEIVNNIGQTVFKTIITGQTMTVSLNSFSNGIYLARFVSADNTQSLKIVVRH